MTQVAARTGEGQQLFATALELRPTVRESAEEIERERRIPRPLFERLRDAGLYRMAVPRMFGGLELDWPTLMRVAELMAEADGSVGWNLTNNAIEQLIALSLPDDGVQEIFADGPDAVVAGTAVPGGGSGVAVAGGYRVTGHWRFGSGCQESRWMLGNFTVTEGEGVRRNPDGSPALYRAFFPVGETTIVETWDMTGMRGTGSHDWTVTDVFVPERRTVHVPGALLFNQWQRWPGRLYGVPIHAIIGPHHSLIATGIARAAIDVFKELAGAKVPRGRTGLLRDREQVQEAVARAEAVLGSAQLFRADAVGDVCRTLDDGGVPSLEQVARCRLSASFAVDSARQAIDLVYRAGGTTSSERTHPLARCWRDLQVVGQAASTAPEWYPLVGKVLLGIDPGPRLG